MPDDPLDLSTAVPDVATRDAVLALAADVEAADGAPPLSDQTRSALRADRVRHVTARFDHDVVGYGQLDGDGAEVVADPGVLDALLDALLPDRPRVVLVWSHGHRSRLIESFTARGFTRVRELYQLRRPLDAGHPLPEDAPLPDGATVRAFEPGRDDAAWLDVNAAAFATHPEQGAITKQDLDARMAEDWFDPAGFLLAERDGQLLGFHWTKVHPDGAGEVYVLGIGPDAQGLGLGSALLDRGLHHLQDKGCAYVLLYVDGDNPGAVRLYERAGFERYDVDVQWTTG